MVALETVPLHRPGGTSTYDGRIRLQGETKDSFGNPIGPSCLSQMCR
jgi:hypothetical protein